MNRREAKKAAARAVAALVDRNLAMGEGELFVGTEGMSDHDADLWGEAMSDLLAELWRRAFKAIDD